MTIKKSFSYEGFFKNLTHSNTSIYCPSEHKFLPRNMLELPGHDHFSETVQDRRSSELQQLSTQNYTTNILSRDILSEWISIMRILLQNGRTINSTYDRESSAPVDKATNCAFLKFTDDVREYIWNGVLHWKEIRLYERTKFWQDGYVPIPWVKIIEIVCSPD